MEINWSKLDCGLAAAIGWGQTEEFRGTIRLEPPVDLSEFVGVRHMKITNRVATFRGLDLDAIAALSNIPEVIYISESKLLRPCGYLK